MLRRLVLVPGTLWAQLQFFDSFIHLVSVVRATGACPPNTVSFPARSGKEDCQPLDDASREAVEFLRANMPAFDRPHTETLFDGGLVGPTVNISLTARALFPWARTVPKEVFFDAVLPYASVNEARTDWRPLLFEKLKGLFLKEGTKSKYHLVLFLREKMVVINGVLMLYRIVVRMAVVSVSKNFHQKESCAARCEDVSVILVHPCVAFLLQVHDIDYRHFVQLHMNNDYPPIWCIPRADQATLIPQESDILRIPPPPQTQPPPAISRCTRPPRT